MININQQTIGGVVEEIHHGKEPLPWMAMAVKAGAMVWDRHGKRAQLWTMTRVVIQGSENVGIYSPLIEEGTKVFAIGQRVPAFSVANAAPFRGDVLLASVFQLQE